jgi:DNA-directed RNA polymerase specialized sigma24 family protein
VLQKKNSAAPLLARLSSQRGEVIDLVYFHGKSVTEIAEIVGIAEAGVRCHGGRYGRPYRAGWSIAEPMERD